MVPSKSGMRWSQRTGNSANDFSYYVAWCFSSLGFGKHLCSCENKLTVSFWTSQEIYVVSYGEKDVTIVCFHSFFLFTRVRKQVCLIAPLQYNTAIKLRCSQPKDFVNQFFFSFARGLCEHFSLCHLKWNKTLKRSNMFKYYNLCSVEPDLSNTNTEEWLDLRIIGGVGGVS